MIIWLNTDASFREKSHACGIGCFVQLETGETFQWHTYETGVHTTQQAETLGLWYGVKRIMNEFGAKDTVLIVANDNNSLIWRINELLENDDLPWTDLERRICFMIRKFKFVGIKWVPRENNRMADKLARQGLSEYMKEQDKLKQRKKKHEDKKKKYAKAN